MIPRIVIKKSWFYSAGDKYGWMDEFRDSRGVGISVHHLEKNDHLVVEVDRIGYKVDCRSALEIIGKYKSKFQINNVSIGVVPKESLKPL